MGLTGAEGPPLSCEVAIVLTTAASVTPAGPSLGLTVIIGVVTVNVPVADWPPTSVTVTVVPEVPLGTAKVQENPPKGPVFNDPLVQPVIVTESKSSLAVLRSEKPVPDTLTVAPAGPSLGLTVIIGVVTLNVPVADWPPTSVTVTVVPEVPLGTAKVQENPPKGPVFNDPLVQPVIVTESKSSVTALRLENPVPDTFAVDPIGPCAGLNAVRGVVRAKATVLLAVPVASS